jgi:hypothetical protein
VDSKDRSGRLASRKCAGSVLGPVALVGFLDSHRRIGFGRSLTSMNLLLGFYIKNLIWFDVTHNLANPFLFIQIKPKFNNRAFTRTLKPKQTRKDLMKTTANSKGFKGQGAALKQGNSAPKEITPAYLKAMTKRFDLGIIFRLDLSGMGLRTIKPLEECIMLQYLDISNNNLREVNALETCKDLSHLNANMNIISEVKGLRNLRRLKCILLLGNQMIDSKNLENLKNCVD